MTVNQMAGLAQMLVLVLVLAVLVALALALVLAAIHKIGSVESPALAT
jgi:hypothetical protein